MVYSSKILTETFGNAKSVSDIIYETETNWDTLMGAVSDIEEESREKYGKVIYEAVNIKAFFGKIKEFFKNLFEKIKKFFIAALDKIKGIFTNKKNEELNKKLTKHKSQLKVPDTTEPIFKDASIYTNLEHEPEYEFNYYLGKVGYSEVVRKINDLIDDDSDALKNFNDDISNLYERNLFGAKNRIRGALLYDEEDHVIYEEDYKKELEKFFGISNHADLCWKDIKIDDAIKITGSTYVISEIEKSFSEQERVIKANIDWLDKKIGSVATHQQNTDYGEKRVDLILFYFNALKDFYNDIIQYDQVKITAIKGNIDRSIQIAKMLEKYNNLE